MEAPVVVVGASLAGLRAAEAARRAGDRRVVLVGAEEHLPYDRPPLSKAFLGAAGDPPSFRTAAELADLGIELRLGTPATGVDLAARELLAGGERLPYAALVVATGAHARHLPGERLAGVHALRTLDDATQVRTALEAGARTVVVGAGFIGSEVASAARERSLPVTVVEAASAPFERAVGAVAAERCTRLHAAAGTDLRCGHGVARLEGEGRVSAVVLTDGTRLPAELVVVGIGAEPTTGWLEASGLDLGDGVVCGSDLRTSDPHVWAAGDVASVDHPTHGRVRLEHWTSAAEQGALAGANAVAALRGEPVRQYTGVPYFWSDLYGRRLQMVGLPAGDAEVLGEADGPWLVLYRRGDRLAGALGLDLPGRIMKFRALLSRRAEFAEALDLARSVPLPVRAAAS
ncbi:MAG TPA: FAD-dependent oxidoreductase [Mycobacteriales bacterium]|nr:FAD-dependent oxidoreductase [Mycobacteriales bacterium]